MPTKRLLDLSGIAGFLVISAAGAVVVTLVCLLAPVTVQIACIGILVVLILSLAVVRELRPSLPEQFHLLNAPMTLATE